jgi:hypothetical protein
MSKSSPPISVINYEMSVTYRYKFVNNSEISGNFLLNMD